jgi:hypothetical protein
VVRLLGRHSIFIFDQVAPRSKPCAKTVARTPFPSLKRRMKALYLFGLPAGMDSDPTPNRPNLLWCPSKLYLACALSHCEQSPPLLNRINNALSATLVAPTRASFEGDF